MKRIHPKLGEAVALAAMVCAAGLAGCRSQAGSMPSPFLAPDRVPPPATRALMPGQAQPYYPGDPLPVMQSGIAPPAPTVTSASTPTSPQPTGNSGLAWGAAGQAAANSQVSGAVPPRVAALSSEPAVAVPADGESLRFALPVAAPMQSTQVLAAAPQTQQQVAQLSTVPQPGVVVPATYNAPVQGSSTSATVPAANGGATSMPQPPPTSPWRSPQIALSTTPQGGGMLPAAVTGVPQVASQPSTMDVRMRAVPSPPPEPLESTAPRIRLPGYSTSQPIGFSSSITQPAPFYATIAPASYGITGPQMVQVSPVPTSYGGSTTLAAMPATSISPDGFRPRGSMR